MKRLRLAFILMFIFTFILVLTSTWWITHPSSMYYKEISTTIEKDSEGIWYANITRDLPHGDIWVKWGIDVWVRRGDGSFVCSMPILKEPVLYRVGFGNEVRYELPPEITRCLNSAPPIQLTWNRQVMLWGWLPLYPIETPITVASPAQITNSDE